MNCDKCQDQGIILVAVKGWDNGIWDSPHARCSYPSYDDSDYHPLVMNCPCHYDHAINNDSLVATVMKWIENKQLPAEFVGQTPRRNVVETSKMTNSEMVTYFAKSYLAGSCNLEDVSKIKDEDLYPDSYQNDVGWFMVGHNSSHHFYLGIKDDKILKRSTEVVDELTIPEEEYFNLLNSDNVNDHYIAYENCRQVLKETITEVTRDKIGYIGHY